MFCCGLLVGLWIIMLCFFSFVSIVFVGIFFAGICCIVWLLIVLVVVCL